jgi:hypothetical protein
MHPGVLGPFAVRFPSLFQVLLGLLHVSSAAKVRQRTSCLVAQKTDLPIGWNWLSVLADVKSTDDTQPSRTTFSSCFCSWAFLSLIFLITACWKELEYKDAMSHLRLAHDIRGATFLGGFDIARMKSL